MKSAPGQLEPKDKPVCILRIIAKDVMLIAVNIQPVNIQTNSTLKPVVAANPGQIRRGPELF